MGVHCGVIKEEADAIEAIVDMGGFSFIELGPVSVDPQHQPTLRTQLIRINQAQNKVAHKFS